ncbi:GNAT family N-acetyltransferase [Photobacterium sp. 1_MG-2023]|uniref:GNAT family N-acetyltransferase n=1 Tax=Photobacterium sp. 1_MG-2023 TaxID=3062646 RepID=UPI0026E39070|nr:GNAT family N-acetyltransferase [Photobacterium sp. 1_MG-2023]MDO6708627.1 GNAT family N-acetyltransferase [Photobacterium sp. 1_MG-2023]
METIRTARPQDLEGLLRLYRALRPHDQPLTAPAAEAHWEALLAQPNTRIIVADIDGTLASTCQLGLVPTLTNGAKPFGVIEHVITTDQYRRRGLSQKVIEKALALAWELDCYKVMLLSGETRTAAHQLYEKIGFQSGIERGFVIKPRQV